MTRTRPLFVVVVAAIFLPSTVLAGGVVCREVVVVVAPRGAVVVTSSSPVFSRPAPSVVAPIVVTPHHFVSRFGTPVIVTRPFFPIVVSVPPAIVYSPPVIGVQPTPIGAPSPLPMPALNEYPTGWYQLRGDGMTTPYVWVWISKPPPPPTEAPPATPLAPSSPPSQAPREPWSMLPLQQSSTSSGTLYRWIDEQGVENWTDRYDTIPERYRVQAQRF